MTQARRTTPCQDLIGSCKETDDAILPGSPGSFGPSPDKVPGIFIYKRLLSAFAISRMACWKPGPLTQRIILVCALLVSLALMALHLTAGFDYEFHLLFGIPVFVVAWYLGSIAGYAMAFIVASLWLAADFRLEGSQAAMFPLLFNSVFRVCLFASAVALLSGLRSVLERERRFAREDPLTGLPNRREFIEQGSHALALARRQDIPMTAIFIDLDRFKEVNDLHGHKAGDEVLIMVSAVLRKNLRASDVCGRLGGDEFALLLPGMNAVDAARYAEKLRSDLIQSMQSRDWPVRFSIGVASHAQPLADFFAVIATADALMYEVKRSGRDRILQRAYEAQ